MTVLVLQHAPDDRLGFLLDGGFEIRLHKAFEEPVLPALSDFEALVLLGGPQMAYSDEGFPSRRNEIDHLQTALAADMPILGICLGAQLLAVAAGSEGMKGPHPEIGWFPVELTLDGIADRLFRGCPTKFTPRSNHNDTYVMPRGAVRLAASERYPDQGFRLGERAWGIQFHFEVDVFDRVTTPATEELAAMAPISRRIAENFGEVVREVTAAG